MRRLKRWLAVAIVWAMAGSAVGVIALIETRSGRDEEARTTATALSRLQNSLERRLDSLERKLDEQSKRVDKVEGSLEEANSSASSPRARARRSRR